MSPEPYGSFVFVLPSIRALVSGELVLVCVLTGLTAGSDPRLFPAGKLGLGILSAVHVPVWPVRHLFAGGPEL